jgi:hypothetical protein
LACQQSVWNRVPHSLQMVSASPTSIRDWQTPHFVNTRPAGGTTATAAAPCRGVAIGGTVIDWPHLRHLPVRPAAEANAFSTAPQAQVNST